jgi:hypothetical protein
MSLESFANEVHLNMRSNICTNGNRPAQSKHTLLKTWPAPETVRNVAKFIGFAQFYLCFIHNFELWIAPLRKITKEEFTDLIAPYWNDAAQASLDDMKDAILTNLCLLRFDYQKLIVLCTDFSCIGFGWVLCQPGDKETSNNTMQKLLVRQRLHFYDQGIIGNPPPSVLWWSKEQRKRGQASLSSWRNLCWQLWDEQVQTHAFWTAFCLGDGLLGFQVCLIL